MLWLALHLPWLPLEALPLADDRPRCVVEQRQVLVAGAAARIFGVTPGMSAATAGSLAPQVQQLAREPAREAEFVHALALAMARFTPNLVVQADVVLLDVAATARLFGGVRALLRAVRVASREAGAHPRIALAPTASAAALLARTGDARRALALPRMRRLLDALPLSPALDALTQPPRLSELLQTIGCRRVADVRALPRAGLVRRGARELLAALDRAYGDAPDPQPWFEVPERFAMSLELMHRADDATQLVFACQRLVAPLSGWLERQWLAASRLRLKLRHERGRRTAPDEELVIELGAPSREAAQIMMLLRERLNRHRLAAPVYAIELSLDEAVSHAGQEGRLIPDPGQQAQDFQALLDRLASRLGGERVMRIARANDHRPERASVAHPVAQAVTSEDAAPTPSRPLWLLREPLRLPEHDGVPMHGSALALLTRAERIEAGWFDGALVCRDYHVAEGGDHRLRWIFRERGSGWFLHGLFG